MEIPALAARALGATRVISVHLPIQGPAVVPSNMFQVVNRCFQIMHARTEHSWRSHSDVVIEPDVRGINWDAFQSGEQIVAAGEKAALEALPQILYWSARVSPPHLGLGTPLLSAGA